MKTRTCGWETCNKPLGIDNQTKYCDARCRVNQAALRARRKAGVVPLSEKTLSCVECGTTFPPTGRDKFCSIICRNTAANRTRREKGAVHSVREQMLERLEVLTNPDTAADTEKATIELQVLGDWPTKAEHFKTDERWPETREIITEVQRWLEQEGKMGLRSMFYHLVSTPSALHEGNILKNTIAVYGLFCAKVTDARLRGDLAPDALSDSLRESILFSDDGDPTAYLNYFADQYTLNPWTDQNDFVEFMVEKDSVVASLDSTVRTWRTPLHVLRGQGSNPYAYEVASHIAGLFATDSTKRLFMYYLGDHDADGYGIERAMKERVYSLLLEELGWSPRDIYTRIIWRRIGFLHEDFENHDVEALDANAKADSSNFAAFAKAFPDLKAAELEALPPTELRARITTAIAAHLDTDTWDASIAHEQAIIASLKERLQ